MKKNYTVLLYLKSESGDMFRNILNRKGKLLFYNQLTYPIFDSKKAANAFIQSLMKKARKYAKIALNYDGPRIAKAMCDEAIYEEDSQCNVLYSLVDNLLNDSYSAFKNSKQELTDAYFKIVEVSSIPQKEDILEHEWIAQGFHIYPDFMMEFDEKYHDKSTNEIIEAITTVFRDFYANNKENHGILYNRNTSTFFDNDELNFLAKKWCDYVYEEGDWLFS